MSTKYTEEENSFKSSSHHGNSIDSNKGGAAALKNGNGKGGRLRNNSDSFSPSDAGGSHKNVEKYVKAEEQEKKGKKKKGKERENEREKVKGKGRGKLKEKEIGKGKEKEEKEKEKEKEEEKGEDKTDEKGKEKEEKDKKEDYVKEAERDQQLLEEEIKEKDAKASALTLEILGDIPDADLKPPENVLFVCKLNPATPEEDLETIFSKFGEIISCKIIKDPVTNNSKQYGFIEFKNKEDCLKAYFEMDNTIIDDRRIHVDFCQSLAKYKKLTNSYAKESMDYVGKNRFNDFTKRGKHVICPTDINEGEKVRIVRYESDDSDTETGKLRDEEIEGERYHCSEGRLNREVRNPESEEAIETNYEREQEHGNEVNAQKELDAEEVHKGGEVSEEDKKEKEEEKKKKKEEQGQVEGEGKKETEGGDKREKEGEKEKERKLKKKAETGAEQNEQEGNEKVKGKEREKYNEGDKRDISRKIVLQPRGRENAGHYYSITNKDFYGNRYNEYRNFRYYKGYSSRYHTSYNPLYSRNYMKPYNRNYVAPYYNSYTPYYKSYNKSFYYHGNQNTDLDVRSRPYGNYRNKYIRKRSHSNEQEMVTYERVPRDKYYEDRSYKKEKYIYKPKDPDDKFSRSLSKGRENTVRKDVRKYTDKLGDSYYKRRDDFKTEKEYPYKYRMGGEYRKSESVDAGYGNNEKYKTKYTDKKDAYEREKFYKKYSRSVSYEKRAYVDKDREKDRDRDREREREKEKKRKRSRSPSRFRGRSNHSNVSKSYNEPKRGKKTTSPLKENRGLVGVGGGGDEEKYYHEEYKKKYNEPTDIGRGDEKHARKRYEEKEKGKEKEKDGGYYKAKMYYSRSLSSTKDKKKDSYKQEKRKGAEYESEEERNKKYKKNKIPATHKKEEKLYRETSYDGNDKDHGGEYEKEEKKYTKDKRYNIEKDEKKYYKEKATHEADKKKMEKTDYGIHKGGHEKKEKDYSKHERLSYKYDDRYHNKYVNERKGYHDKEKQKYADSIDSDEGDRRKRLNGIKEKENKSKYRDTRRDENFERSSSERDERKDRHERDRRGTNKNFKHEDAYTYYKKNKEQKYAKDLAPPQKKIGRSSVEDEYISVNDANVYSSYKKNKKEAYVNDNTSVGSC